MAVDGAKVYLIGHGYAPVFKVTDTSGKVVYDQATPFVAGTSGNFLSEGVVKVRDYRLNRVVRVTAGRTYVALSRAAARAARRSR